MLAFSKLGGIIPSMMYECTKHNYERIQMFKSMEDNLQWSEDGNLGIILAKVVKFHTTVAFLNRK